MRVRPVSGLLFLLLLFAAISVAQTTGPSPAPWPQDRAAAVSLTFDDGMNTHLDNVGPVLKKHGLHGTFYVITGRSNAWRTRPDDWKRLAAEGNEIGSHTVNHPCLLERIEVHSQDYTPEMMYKELHDSSREIVARLGIQRGLTFAFPCGNMTFGPPALQTVNQALYFKDVADFYFAARAYNSSSPQDPEELSPLTISSLGTTTGKDSASLVALMQEALRVHTWGVYAFHGVGGEWLSVSTEALDGLAAYLEQHHEIWTAPLGDVVRYIQESKTLKILPKEISGQGATFGLEWPLDAKIFDMPLTLKWQLPDEWKACQAEADGRPLACTVRDTPGHKAALVDVPSGTKVLQYEAR